MRLYDYAASANCYKARLLLAQLGLPYERAGGHLRRRVDDAGLPCQEPFRANAGARARFGETIAESNAILLYLGEGTPGPATFSSGRASGSGSSSSRTSSSRTSAPRASGA